MSDTSTTDDRPLPVLAARCPIPMHAAVEALADRQGQRKGTVVRELIADSLRRRGLWPPKAASKPRHPECSGEPGAPTNHDNHGADMRQDTDINTASSPRRATATIIELWEDNGVGLYLWDPTSGRGMHTVEVLAQVPFREQIRAIHTGDNEVWEEAMRAIAEHQDETGYATGGFYPTSFHTTVHPDANYPPGLGDGDRTCRVAVMTIDGTGTESLMVASERGDFVDSDGASHIEGPPGGGARYFLGPDAPVG